MHSTTVVSETVKKRINSYRSPSLKVLANWNDYLKFFLSASVLGLFLNISIAFIVVTLAPLTTKNNAKRRVPSKDL